MSTARTARGARTASASAGRRAGAGLRTVGACGGALALVVVAAGGAAASAGATGAVPLPLAPDPDGVSSLVVPVENLPGLELTDVLGTDAYTTVPVDPGGEVRIALPDGLEVPDVAGVTLRMADIDEPEPDGPDPLTFTADGSSALTAEVADGVLTVGLPPEEELRLDEEDEGVLTFPTTSDVPGYADETAFYDLDLGSGVAAPEVDLAPVLLTTSSLEGPSVPAGGSLELSVPADSVLRDAGVSSLADVLVVLDDLDRDDVPPAPEVDAAADAAVVTLGEATEPGDYRAAVLLAPTDEDGAPLAQRASATSVAFEVLDAVAPAPEPSVTPEPAPTPSTPASNPGLRSNTGVEDAAPGADRGTLLLGGGLALLAAAGAVVVAVRRRPGR